MGLRDKYGGNSRIAVRRAIREEMVCGNEVLDTLELLHYIVTQLKKRGLAGQDEAQAALDSMCSLRDLMAKLVKRKYAD